MSTPHGFKSGTRPHGIPNRVVCTKTKTINTGKIRMCIIFLPIRHFPHVPGHILTAFYSFSFLSIGTENEVMADTIWRFRISLSGRILLIEKNNTNTFFLPVYLWLPSVEYKQYTEQCADCKNVFLALYKAAGLVWEFNTCHLAAILSCPVQWSAAYYRCETLSQQRQTGLQQVCLRRRDRAPQVSNVSIFWMVRSCDEKPTPAQSTYIPRVPQCLSIVRIGTSPPPPPIHPPLPQASVFLPRNQRGRAHTRLWVRGWGSQFGRLEKTPTL